MKKKKEGPTDKPREQTAVPPPRAKMKAIVEAGGKIKKQPKRQFISPS